MPEPTLQVEPHPATATGPPRFGDPDVTVYALVPSVVASMGFVASAFATASDLQPVPYRGWFWLLLWPLLFAAACATALGHDTARRAVVVWAGVSVLLRIREGELWMAVVYVMTAWTLHRARSGPLVGPLGRSRARRLRWALGGAALCALDLVVRQGVGEVWPVRLDELPRVERVHPAFPTGEVEWVAEGARLVARDGALVLDGARWVRGREVVLAPDRDALVIGGAVFRREERGEDTPGSARFSREFGRVRGDVVVSRTADEVRLRARLKVDYRVLRHEVVLRRR